MSLHDTHMVLILSCFLGACWYFPVKVAGECPSLVLFDHFSSASTVEISLSSPSSCPVLIDSIALYHCVDSGGTNTVMEIYKLDKC